MALDGDQEEDEDELSAGGVIHAKKVVYQPSKAEWDDHQRIHIPFRKWCPCCVKGRSINGAHSKGKKSESQRK